MTKALLIRKVEKHQRALTAAQQAKAEFERRRQIIARAAAAVAELHGFTFEKLRSEEKTGALSRARITAMVVASELSQAPDQEVAEAFGRAHHDSVRHARKVVARKTSGFEPGGEWIRQVEKSRAAAMKACKGLLPERTK